MRVQFYGVRGSIATAGDDTRRYGGNTSCVVVEAGGETIIFDAGTGIRAAGAAIMTIQGAAKGVPGLADAVVGRRILERMQRLSAPLGTTIAIENGVGVIRVAAK